MRNLMTISAAVFLMACSDLEPKTEAKKSIPPTAESSLDSVRIRTTKLFVAATAEYIKEFYKERNPDTVFLSRNPDFPDITLPAMIEAVPIRIIQTQEGHDISKRRAMTILNLIDLGGDEFMIVTFKEGFRPQYNCHMFFSYDKNKSEYFLDSLRKENPYIKERTRSH